MKIMTTGKCLDQRLFFVQCALTILIAISYSSQCLPLNDRIPFFANALSTGGNNYRREHYAHYHRCVSFLGLHHARGVYYASGRSSSTSDRTVVSFLRRDKHEIISTSTNSYVSRLQSTSQGGGNDVIAGTNNRHAEEIEKEYIIRNAKYKDLRAVIDILVSAFYAPSPRLLRHYYLLKELDRLQSNFSYGDQNHVMYVACPKSDNNKVIAFCDLDMRPPRVARAPPRPYLSDLAVHEEWRRKGIARDLITKCECTATNMGKNVLHLRVEAANTVAINMYDQLGYRLEPSLALDDKDTTILLKRNFDEPRTTLVSPLQQQQLSMESAAL